MTNPDNQNSLTLAQMISRVKIHQSSDAESSENSPENSNIWMEQPSIRRTEIHVLSEKDRQVITSSLTKHHQMGELETDQENMQDLLTHINDCPGIDYSLIPLIRFSLLRVQHRLAFQCEMSIVRGDTDGTRQQYREDIADIESILQRI